VIVAHALACFEAFQREERLWLEDSSGVILDLNTGV